MASEERRCRGLGSVQCTSLDHSPFAFLSGIQLNILRSAVPSTRSSDCQTSSRSSTCANSPSTSFSTISTCRSSESIASRRYEFCSSVSHARNGQWSRRTTSDISSEESSFGSRGSFTSDIKRFNSCCVSTWISSGYVIIWRFFSCFQRSSELFFFPFLGKAPPPKIGAKPSSVGPKPSVKPVIPNGMGRAVPTPPPALSARSIPTPPSAPKAPSTPGRPMNLGGGEARPPGAGDLAAALAKRGRKVAE